MANGGRITLFLTRATICVLLSAPGLLAHNLRRSKRTGNMIAPPTSCLTTLKQHAPITEEEFIKVGRISAANCFLSAQSGLLRKIHDDKADEMVLPQER